MKSKPTAITAVFFIWGCFSSLASSQNADWPLPGGQAGGGHFSTATKITPENVSQLKAAWTHRSGDFRKGANFRDGLKPDTALQSSWQATPVLAGDNLVICTPFNRIIAINAATGEKQWSYTPDINLDDYAMPRCRGVTQWQHPNNSSNDACHSIIIAPLMNAKVIGLDAHTGQRCHFGAVAEINLREGLRPHAPGDYTLNTPPAILGNLLITGAAVADNISVDVPSGVVRAYDLFTGQLTWAWDPVPPSVEDRASQDSAEAQALVTSEDGAAATAHTQGKAGPYQPGTSNVWSFISVDEKLNRVYVPTGNTSPDYYGGHRNGSDFYSSSVVALEANTGNVIWHYQTVHHDIWDFDVPSQPTLFDVTTESGVVHGLAQTTKQGYVFLLDRVTGEPLFPVVEQPMP
ncbi:MAG: PQQ-binding-like beta-propeller repeat protein, partial [Halieaceae bacterium]|nr:PQQ-binding-like beta-propeller repeat protein [Halieaceae bacterium]